MSLEIKISEGDGDIAKHSLELASIIKVIQENEDRWIELSELAESIKFKASSNQEIDPFEKWALNRA